MRYERVLETGEIYSREKVTGGKVKEGGEKNAKRSSETR